MGLDALLLACSDMYELNTETEPSVKCLRLESDHENSQVSATTSKRSFVPPKTQQEMCKAKLSAIPASTAADTKPASRFGINGAVTDWRSMVM